MKISLEPYLIKEKSKVSLKDFSTRADSKIKREEVEQKIFPSITQEICVLQEKLWAEHRHGIIILFQGMDAAGKDSAVKRVFSEVNPAGLSIVSFKAPSSEELDHDYLWRINKALPQRGVIGIFNRSHYEDVVTVRLHNLISSGTLPDEIKNDADIWKDRYEQICNWEKYLYQNGFRMIKIFLHVSKEEQRARLAERIINPEKHYKFDLSDIRERQYWDKYQDLYSDMLSRSSTRYAPWYVLPADNKWYTRTLIAMLVRDVLKDIDPKFPPMAEDVKGQIHTIQKLFEDVDIKEFGEMLKKLTKSKAEK